MEKKNSKLIIVEHNVDWTKVCFLSFFFLFCLGYYSLTTAQSIEIWPVEISFNFEAGDSNDAVTIRKNVSETITVPEYKLGVRYEKCAYIKGQSNRKIKVKFNSNSSNMNFLVKATIVSGTGIGNVCEGFVAACDLNTNAVTLYLSGTLPSTIGKRNFTWKWEATALPVSYPYCPITCVPCYTYHTYYTLFNTPQEPLAEPWTDVLDKACVWALGQSTDSGVLNALTTNLYTISGLYYNGGQSHYEYDSWPNSTKFTFNLTDFLDEWDYADCQDCSMFLSILSGSLGASLTQTRRIEGYFYTKAILPVGWSSDASFRWDYHHIGWLINVYDPGIKLKPSSSPYIPINVDIDNPYKVDLYDDGNDWLPLSPFHLGETDPNYNCPTEIQ